MVRQFYRSLDRPMDLFGLKGRWIRTFLVALGACGFPAVFAGIAVDIGMGVAVMLGGGGLAFLACIILQGKTSERQLDKFRLEGKMNRFVRRRENVSRILLEDARWKKAKQSQSSS